MCSLKKCIKFFTASVFTSLFISITALGYNVKAGTVAVETALNMRASASTNAEVITTLESGSVIVVTDQADGWLEIVADGTTGYVSQDYIFIQDVADFDVGYGIITGSSVNIRSDASENATILGQLKKSASVKICGVNNGWYKIEDGESLVFVSGEYVKLAQMYEDNVTSSLRSSIVEYAKTFLGVKYVYGGTSPKGFDCSGFTQYVYAEFDISLSRTSASQVSNCTKISKSELKLGDLVFFSSHGSSVGHVGIYIGNNQFIHASSPGDYVKITSLSESYYLARYIRSGSIVE